MRDRRTTASIALVAGAALALSACSAFAPDHAFVEPAGVPETYTAPGTELGLDEVARVVNDDPRVDYAIQVRHAEEADGSVFDALANPEDFEEFTPFVVVTQFTTLDEIEKDADPAPTFLALGGVLGNGEFAGVLDDGFGANICPESVPGSSEGGAQWRLTCVIFLVPEGEELETLGFYGYNPYGITSFIEPGNEEYEENPILWTL